MELSQANIPVEAEVKLGMAEAERGPVAARLLGLGFRDTGTVEQIDYYVEYESSDLGGINFSRLRSEHGVYSWNRKRHTLDANSTKVRLEESRDLSVDEFNTMLSQASAEPIIIRKQRSNYTGFIKTWPATVSLDVVVLGGETKYFIEVEVMTDVEHGAEVRTLCKTWAREALGVTGPESVGYLNQYLAARTSL
jgi:adenylate cyclase class IV